MTPPNSRMHDPDLIAALVTPFTPDHRVDRPSLAPLVAYLQRGGVDQFFVIGSSGEAPLLDTAMESPASKRRGGGIRGSRMPSPSSR